MHITIARYYDYAYGTVGMKDKNDRLAGTHVPLHPIPHSIRQHETMSSVESSTWTEPLVAMQNLSNVGVR
jgi:hypothetical protein